MKDIHSHILFDIDDGSCSIDESLEILKQAVSNNYTDIILTPHYRKRQNYVANNKVKLERFDELLNEVKKEKLKVNLYLGNEVTVDEDLIYYLDTKQVVSLNSSRYILLELPFTSKLDCLEDLFDELFDRGMIPIIPHPERYTGYTIEDYKRWIERGVLFQGNIETLYNGYGEKSKKILTEMLKYHMIHFMGSDIHKASHGTYDRNIKEKLEEILQDKKMVLELTDKNIECVIKNKEIKPYKVLEEKKRFKIFNR